MSPALIIHNLLLYTKIKMPRQQMTKAGKLGFPAFNYLTSVLPTK